jgi:oligosaccharide repeat unit polymerase
LLAEQRNQPHFLHSRWGTVVFAHTCALILALAAIPFYHVTGVEPDTLEYGVCVMLGLLLVWLFVSWKLVSGGVFDPYGLFLISVALFGCGQAILEIFHLNERGLLSHRFDADTTIATVWLTIVSLASLHFGCLLAVRPRPGSSASDRAAARSLPALTRHIEWLGWCLLLVSIVPTMVLLRGAVDLVRSAGYFALYNGREAATSVGATPEVLAGFMVPATLFLLAGSRGRPFNIAVTSIVILAYSGVLFYLGDRSGASMPLIAYAWVWHRCIRPLPRAMLITTGALMLIVLFPLVRSVRNTAGEARFSADHLADSFRSINNPVVAIISEMGGSMATVAHTLELVPGTRDFDLGAGYLAALSTVFPNLFWEVHPAISHGTASNWLIWQVDPTTAARGGGLGYSFIAEAYLNFGWCGFILLVGLGFAYARFVLWADRSGDALRIAMLGCFLAFFLRYPRDESNAIVRPLIWYSCIPYVTACFCCRRRPGGLPGVGHARLGTMPAPAGGWSPPLPRTLSGEPGGSRAHVR